MSLTTLQLILCLLIIDYGSISFLVTIVDPNERVIPKDDKKSDPDEMFCCEDSFINERCFLANEKLLTQQ